MKSINKVTLLGHVGQDPKIIATQAGGLVANLTVATSYKSGGKDGREAVEVTEWHRLVAFGRLAEIVRDYVRKGAAVYIEGQLQTRVWEKDGEKRYSTEIVVRDMSMLDRKPAGAPPAARRDVEVSAALANAGITDDDIPF